MSTTFEELRERVADTLQDPNLRTFTETLIRDMVYQALAEVGRFVPDQFTEDIDYVSGQLSYVLRSDTFLGEAVPEIEVMRVEVWDPTQTPAAFISRITPAATEQRAGDTGWYVWNGTLYLPTRSARGLEDHIGEYVIRVWGYSPYPEPVSDADVLSISKEVESAVVAYTHLVAINLLLANRNLFSQWQTRSGNSDMSPAGLMNEKNMVLQEWRQKSRSLMRLRSEV